MTGDQVQVIPPAGARRSLDALRDQIAPDATDDELNYLAALGRRFDLDPVAGQIVLVSRFDKRLGRNVSRPQITADGRLALAQRSGELDGFDGPQWCGPRNAKGGHDWLDLWSDDEPPHAARVYVYRKGRAHPANGTVRWAEFAQRKTNGELMPMWAAMPSHMLGKVALSLGLRRAFPGIVPGDIDDDSDEIIPADDEPAAPMIAEDHRATLGYAIAALPAAAQAWLLPVKNADHIPSIASPRFTETNRDRLSWHILRAQQIHPINPPESAVAPAAPDEGDADEPVPADVHDDTEPA
jgi:hypothetical protein